MITINKAPSRPALLDATEKTILLSVYIAFAFQMVRGWLDGGTLPNLIYVVDQLIILLFILFRRSTTDISLRPGEWFAGFVGTFLPLLVAPVGVGDAVAPGAMILLLMLVGVAVHLGAKLILRRSFGVVAANRGVKVSGPYLFVRHPMYAGYMIVQAGFLLSGPSIQNVAVILTCWALYVWRIRAEERVLSQDEAYVRMMERTRYRLLPGIW